MITQGRLIYSPHCADGALEKTRHAQVSDVPKFTMSESFNDETGAGAIADLRCGTPELTQRGLFGLLQVRRVLAQQLLEFVVQNSLRSGDFPQTSHSNTPRWVESKLSYHGGPPEPSRRGH